MVTLADLIERADQGDGQAMFELGLAYESGQIVDRDLWAAVGYFRQAVDLGLEEPIYHLAMAYESGGDGLERDPCESFFWWLQLAKGGLSSQACLRVGRAYAEGQVVVRDRQEAIFWLEKAVVNGQAEALALLEQLEIQKD
jgi:TPR repeat protein